MSNLLITVGGLVAVATGIWINWGLGWALCAAGVVVFVAGALNSARSERRPR